MLALAGQLILLPAGRAQEPPPPLERYRTLEFPPREQNFDKGWQERVAAEHDVINFAQLDSLRTALKDPDPFVRSIAARALGIRADNASADALAELVECDPEPMVRIRAVESLGYLKRRPDAVERAKEDADVAVQWAAGMAAGQLKEDTDEAAFVRKAYAAGIRREAMERARVGQPAPDFTARRSDGTDFRLSMVLGKKPVALYFAAFDG